MFTNKAAFVSAPAVIIATAFERAITTFRGARGAQSAFKAKVICPTIVGGRVFCARVTRLGQKFRWEEADTHRFAWA